MDADPKPYFILNSLSSFFISADWPDKYPELEVPDNEELQDGAHAGGDAGADDAGAEDANRPHGEAGEDPAEAARKRKRCLACYQGAGNRRLGQKAPKVTTRCGQCEKAFCLPHLHLYCDDCDVGGAAAPRPRLPRLPQLPPPQEPLEQTVERQSLEIAQMRQQMAAMMNLVSSKSKMLILGLHVMPLTRF